MACEDVIPTDLAGDTPPPPHRFSLRLQGPIDIPASVEFLRRNGDDLLDRWDGVLLVRTLPLRGRAIPYACTVDGTVEAPALRVTLADAAHERPAADALRATFISPPADYAAFLRRDPLVAALDQRYRGLRQVRQSDLFAAIVRCISAQQVNLRWATTTRQRLALAFGQRHSVAGYEIYSLDAVRLAGASVAEIRALQFTTRKAEYILHAAEAVADGRLDAEELAALPDDEVIARLVALRGIGLWTAEWILARVLGRPRVVAGDLAVRKAVGMAYLGTPSPSGSAPGHGPLGRIGRRRAGAAAPESRRQRDDAVGAASRWALSAYLKRKGIVWSKLQEQGSLNEAIPWRSRTDRNSRNSMLHRRTSESRVKYGTRSMPN